MTSETNNQQAGPVGKLRAYVAHLEEENLRLRGRQVPSATATALQCENADLRKRLAEETPRSAGPAAGRYLTLPEVAQMLDLSTYEVLRDLRDSLPMGVDAQGHTVVARADVDAVLLARAQGRSPRRFL